MEEFRGLGEGYGEEERGGDGPRKVKEEKRAKQILRICFCPLWLGLNL